MLFYACKIYHTSSISSIVLSLLILSSIHPPKIHPFFYASEIAINKILSFSSSSQCNKNDDTIVSNWTSPVLTGSFHLIYFHKSKTNYSYYTPLKYVQMICINHSFSAWFDVPKTIVSLPLIKRIIYNWFEMKLSIDYQNFMAYNHI